MRRRGHLVAAAPDRSGGRIAGFNLSLCDGIPVQGRALCIEHLRDRHTARDVIELSIAQSTGLRCSLRISIVLLVSTCAFLSKNRGLIPSRWMVASMRDRSGIL